MCEDIGEEEEANPLKGSTLALCDGHCKCWNDWKLQPLKSERVGVRSRCDEDPWNMKFPVLRWQIVVEMLSSETVTTDANQSEPGAVAQFFGDIEVPQ